MQMVRPSGRLQLFTSNVFSFLNQQDHMLRVYADAVGGQVIPLLLIPQRKILNEPLGFCKRHFIWAGKYAVRFKAGYCKPAKRAFQPPATAVVDRHLNVGYVVNLLKVHDLRIGHIFHNFFAKSCLLQTFLPLGSAHQSLSFPQGAR